VKALAAGFIFLYFIGAAMPVVKAQEPSQIHCLYLATKVHKGSQRKKNSRSHPNEKFLGVQTPFFKKGFGRRRQKLAVDLDPYKRILDDPRAFNGPEGAVIDPSRLNSIAIGLFAPFNQSDPAAHDLYRGVKLAIEQANAADGYRGVEFSLVQRWAGVPWAAGSKEVIRLVYEDRVWAIITSGDGAGHIAQQIAAKAYVPVIAPLSSASSLTHTGVPWIFRLPPDDRQQASLLVKEGMVNKHLKRVGVVSGTDQNSRAAAGEMEKELNRQNMPPVFHFKVSPGLLDFQEIGKRIRGFHPHVLTLCLQAPVIPILLKALQSNGIVCPVCMPWVPGVEVKKLQAIYHGPIYMVEPFHSRVQVKAGGIYQRFSRDFEKRFGVLPTFSAAYAYDAAQMIIFSIRSKGLNRPGIRQGLEELAGCEGVSGTIKWDNGGGNPGNPVIRELY
jgi:ABC-type branched-subunit amino acid transport system substrate-binding protein